MVEEQVTQEVTEQPVEQTPETPAVKGIKLAIKGIWTGDAKYDSSKVQQELTVPSKTAKLFYMIESSGKGYGVVTHNTVIMVNGNIAMQENGNIKEGDSTDTGVITLGNKFRQPGTTAKIVIDIRQTNPAGGAVPLYTSPEFTVNYTE